METQAGLYNEYSSFFPCLTFGGDFLPLLRDLSDIFFHVPLTRSESISFSGIRS